MPNEDSRVNKCRDIIYGEISYKSKMIFNIIKVKIRRIHGTLAAFSRSAAFTTACKNRESDWYISS